MLEILFCTFGNSQYLWLYYDQATTGNLGQPPEKRKHHVRPVHTQEQIGLQPSAMSRFSSGVS